MGYGVWAAGNRATLLQKGTSCVAYRSLLSSKDVSRENPSDRNIIKSKYIHKPRKGLR